MSIDYLEGQIRLEHSAKNNEYYAYDENGFICGTLGCNKEKLQELIDLANGFIELQTQLQQAEEREAALIKAFDRWIDTPDFLNDEYDELCGVIDSLRNSPSQPSRYQLMKAVVEAAKDFPLELVEEIVDWYKIVAQEEPAGKHTNETLSGIYDAITVMADALAAYDKAGEGAGVKQLCEDQQGDECTVHDVCAITGKHNCCLACGNSKNCEKRCEYVGQVPVND